MANLLKYSQHLLHNTTGTQTTLLPWYRSAETIFSEKASTTSIYGNSPIINFATNSTGGPFSAQIQQALGSITGGTTLTLSATVKYVDSQFISLGFYDTSWRIQNFDLINNTVGTSMADITNAAIEILSNGIVRIKATFTVPATGTIIIGLLHSESLIVTTATSSFGSIVHLDVHGLQCETGTVANAYEGTTWGTTTQVVAMAAGSIKNWSDKTSWQSGESPLPGDSVNLNTGIGTTSYPRLIVDILSITVKSITFATAQAIKLVILSPNTTLNCTVISGNGGYYSGISWESSGNFTINGDIYVYGNQNNAINYDQGLIKRNGNYLAGILTINGVVTAAVYTAQPSALFMINNTNPTSLDKIICNGAFNYIPNSYNTYSLIYVASYSLNIVFNSLVSILGDPMSGCTFITKSSGSVVVQMEFNNGFTNASGGNGQFQLIQESSGFIGGTKTANGISNKIVLAGTTYIRMYNYSTMTLYLSNLEITGTMQFNALNSGTPILISGDAVLNSPNGTIVNTVGISQNAIVVNNNKEHFIGTINGSTPSSTAPTLFAIIQWTPTAPISTAKMTVNKIISGGTIGINISGSLNPTVLNVTLIETVNPAVETISVNMPAVNSYNKYAKTRIGNATVYKYGSWIVSGRFELLDSSSRITIKSDTSEDMVIGTIPNVTIPEVSDVRFNVPVGLSGSVGTLVVPQASTVQSGVIYDNGTTGTLSIVDDVAAIKAKTDQLTFTTANVVDASSSGSQATVDIQPILDAVAVVQTDVIAVGSTVATIKASTDQIMFDTIYQESDPYIADVVFKSEFESGNYTTESGQTATTLSGNSIPSISSTVSRTGTNSLAVINSTSMQYADQPGFNFGAADFTIEFSVRFNTVITSNTDYAGIIGKRDSNSSFQWIVFVSNGHMTFLTSGTSTVSITHTTPLAINTWYDVAISKSGANLKMFINGVEVTLPCPGMVLSSASTNLMIGRLSASIAGYNMNGYLDRVRLTKNVARYETSPPTYPVVDLYPTSDVGIPLTSRVVSIDSNYVSAPDYTPRFDTLDTITSLVQTDITTVGSAIATIKAKTDQLAFKNVAISVVDPNWSNVSLLLHGDGSNGSTVIVDETGKTVTPSNTTISTSNSKFGGSSIYLNGTGYATVPHIPDFDFVTMPTFTIEAWVYFTSMSTINAIVSNRSGTTDGGAVLRVNTNGSVQFFFTGTASNISSPAGEVTTGIWYHIAVVRDAGTVYLYKDGASIATPVLFSNGTVNSSVPLLIGIGETGASYSSNGYLDEIRITSGVARYSSNFTAPINAFPTGTIVTQDQVIAYGTGSSGSAGTCDTSAIESSIATIDNNVLSIKSQTDQFTFQDVTIDGPIGDAYWNETSLLIYGNGANGSSSIIDEKGLAITANGNAQISTAQSVFGGSSISFDGNGDYLSVPADTRMNLSSGNWTIETWIRLNSYPSTGNMTIFDKDGVINSSYPQYSASISSTGILITALGNGAGTNPASQNIQSVSAIPLNQWVHIAWVRFYNLFLLFINGVLNTTSTITFTMYEGNKPLLIGYSQGQPVASYLNGYIDTFRITKGVSRYLNDFIVPTVEPANTLQLPSQIEKQVKGYYIGSTGGSCDLTPVQVVVDAVKAKTDQLTFTVDGVVSDSSGSSAAVDLSPVTTSLATIQSGVTAIKSNTDKMTFEEVTVSNGASDPDYSSVVFLTGCNTTSGASIFNAITPNTVTKTGSVVIDNSIHKFGDASWYFDGTGGIVDVSSVDLHNSTNFTVELFVYLNATNSGYQHLIGSWDGSTTLGWHIGLSSTGAPSFEVSGTGAYEASNSLISGSAITFNAWHHFALVKTGSTYKLFVDGVVSIQTSSGPTTLYNTGSNITIGQRTGGTQSFKGFVDSIRITDNVARYSGSFTPATEEFIGINGTIEHHIKAMPDVAADLNTLQSLVTLLDTKVGIIKSKTDQLEFLVDGVKASGGNGTVDLDAELLDLETILTAIKTKTDSLTFTTGVNAKDVII